MKHKISTIVFWILSVFFIIGALASIPNIISIFYLITGFFVNPLISTLIYKKTNFQAKVWMKVLLIVLCLILIGISAPAKDQDDQLNVPAASETIAPTFVVTASPTEDLEDGTPLPTSEAAVTQDVKTDVNIIRDLKVHFKSTSLMLAKVIQNLSNCPTEKLC